MADEEQKPVEKTEEEKKEELNARVKSFIKEYGELVMKHNVDFATYPMFVPDNAGGFKIISQSTPIDIGNRPLKSPFVTQE